jgi:hypothetical protein
MPAMSILDLPNLLRGNRATRKASFLDYEAGQEVERECLLVPLTGAEDTEALAYAVAYAQKHGSPEPKPDDPLYDRGYMAKVVSLGIRTVEGGPYFPSAEHVLSVLPREMLLYLYEILEEWQDTCSPFVRRMTEDQLMAGATVLAQGGSESDRFFADLSPGMRKLFTLFMARLWWDSLAPKSPTGSPPIAITTPSSPYGARAKKRGSKR